jgi:hypothetical protein
VLHRPIETAPFLGSWLPKTAQIQISLGPASIANTLCRELEKRTMREQEVQIGKSEPNFLSGRI